jgi:hypothetical protein
LALFIRRQKRRQRRDFQIDQQMVEGEQQQFANQKMQHSGFGQDDTLVASITKPFGGAAEEKSDEQKRWQGKPDTQVDDNKIIGKPDSQPTRGWRPDGNE